MSTRAIAMPIRKTLIIASMMIALSATAGTSVARVVTLRAAAVTKTMPDGVTVIPMWGFALEPPDGDGIVTVPGPRIDLPPGDNTLAIRLRNDLDVATSVVIPGQSATMVPVKFTDSMGRQRARSFAHETAPGTTNTYIWTNLKPGSYLYHSGTHPAVQVQMGLYGAMIRDAAAGQAYPGISYDNDVVLLYSEIDPALHEAVANGTYGTPPTTSTINYAPKFFLINGMPYSAATPPLVAGAAGSRILLRFLNAGLQTHVPTLLGAYVNLLAEDGNPYSFARRRYSIDLPALKTKDALLLASAAGKYALYDRRLFLTNGSAANGGMLRHLVIGGCLYDIDGDGFVGPGDFSYFAPCFAACAADAEWTTYTCGQADFDGSGCVDAADFSFFATGWLKACGDPAIVYPP